MSTECWGKCAVFFSEVPVQKLNGRRPKRSIIIYIRLKHRRLKRALVIRVLGAPISNYVIHDLGNKLLKHRHAVCVHNDGHEGCHSFAIHTITPHLDFSSPLHGNRVWELKYTISVQADHTTCLASWRLGFDATTPAYLNPHPNKCLLLSLRNEHMHRSHLSRTSCTVRGPKTQVFLASHGVLITLDGRQSVYRAFPEGSQHHSPIPTRAPTQGYISPRTREQIRKQQL